MRHHRQQQPTTVVAILGTHTLSEDILAQLLEHEGYFVRHVGAYPTGCVDVLLDGVDILLVAPGLKEGTHEGFLEAMRSTPETAAIPVLTFSDALKMALVDELSAGGFLARPLRGACGADRNLPRKSCCELQASGGRLRGSLPPQRMLHNRVVQAFIMKGSRENPSQGNTPTRR